jgi:polyisoprenoid-binding protein YceI
MRKLKLLIPIAALAISAGCSNPADEVAAAKVSVTNILTAPQATPPDLSATRRLVFGPESSKIEFTGSKVTGSHQGGFARFEGELLVDSSRLLIQPGSRIVIDTDSIWSDSERLTGHLKNADFFDVENFPASTFILTDAVQPGASSVIVGTLNLHGITKEISFPATVELSDQTAEIKAEFSIDRFDFEMKYPGRADDLIRREVVLRLAVRAGSAEATSPTQL